MFTVAAIVMWTMAMAVLAELLPWLAAQLPQWVGAMPDLASWTWPLGPTMREDTSPSAATPGTAQATPSSMRMAIRRRTARTYHRTVAP